MRCEVHVAVRPGRVHRPTTALVEKDAFRRDSARNPTFERVSEVLTKIVKETGSVQFQAQRPGKGETCRDARGHFNQGPDDVRHFLYAWGD